MKPKLKLSKSEFIKLIEPKLKLFLSVDVVGSTEFKQRGDATHAQPWLNFFIGFLAGFPGVFKITQDQESSEEKNCTLDAKLWKSLGDELIFTAELKTRHEAGAYLRAFRAALSLAVENWKTAWASDSAPERDLRLKGTAWLVGFPVGNAEIPLETSSSSDIDGRDYIGPQVDTGFRLKDHSSPRKMVISADLAYLLTTAGTTNIKLFHEGDASLKGVIRGQPYPIIWLDCDGTAEGQPSLHSLKDKLLGREAADPQKLRAYLALWLGESKGRIPKPFISSDPFQDLRKPAGYDKHLEEIKGSLLHLLVVEEDTTENGAGTSATPSGLDDFLKGE